MDWDCGIARVGRLQPQAGSTTGRYPPLTGTKRQILTTGYSDAASRRRTTAAASGRAAATGGDNSSPSANDDGADRDQEGARPGAVQPFGQEQQPVRIAMVGQPGGLRRRGRRQAARGDRAGRERRRRIDEHHHLAAPQVVGQFRNQLVAHQHGHVVIRRQKFGDPRPGAVVAPQAVAIADHESRLGHAAPRRKSRKRRRSRARGDGQPAAITRRTVGIWRRCFALAPAKRRSGRSAARFIERVAESHDPRGITGDRQAVAGNFGCLRRPAGGRGWRSSVASIPL